MDIGSKIERNRNKIKARTIFPLLPVRDIVVFPYMVVPLLVGRPKSVEALEEAMDKDRLLGLVTQKEIRIDEPKIQDIYQIGTLGEILQFARLPDGSIKILVEGICRLKIKEFISNKKFFQVIADTEEEEAKEVNLETVALMRTAASQFENYVKLNARLVPETAGSVSNIKYPGQLADSISTHLQIKLEDKQKILGIFDPLARLKKIGGILSAETEILHIEKKIQGKVRHHIEKTQKEYYLQEQMKAIQDELGKKDGQNENQELRKQILEAKMTPEAEEKSLKELGRLERMLPVSPEAGVVRNYLDWLISLPWSKMTEDKLDINAVEKILEEDHYGLKKVKERILEYLAVRKLVKKMKGPILCFVGPPGVGKTSLAKSIARALGRNFVRVSLGGVRDEAEIRGHRRTYIGSLPGRIVQSIKKAKSRNPVFLLDEVDKMSVDFRGDPSAALLEVLDPEQNHSFSDHYLEVDFDLSDTMFITTANLQLNIPLPLQDRMEIIKLSGYTEWEKLKIAELFLIPKQLAANGLDSEKLTISSKAILTVIRSYTREAGVRNLEREIASLCRKTAKELVSNGHKEIIKITNQNLSKFLGHPRFILSKGTEKDEIGVAQGLAWTEVGGEVMNIEVSILKGRRNLTLTGKLGEVMRESAQAALSYTRSKAKQLGLDENFYRFIDIHIHIPEGAIAKDGPSAGITMATALISALTRRKVSKQAAMTGEITLRGKVLPIGGVKAKVLAAHRSKVKKIILPKENKKDLEEIPVEIRREMNFVLVEHMDEVLKEALLNSKKG
ncbi:MAG: endopeptidase La [Candidatus Ratteibacteria bacterium]|nr:endopeptidase La [Candidatus Ratteibacteria bacterium]